MSRPAAASSAPEQHARRRARRALPRRARRDRRARGAALARGLRSSSRCPTRARRSGTSRTRPGSSRRSCSSPREPGYAPFDPAFRVPLQLVLRRGRRAARAARAAGSSSRPVARRGARLPRARSTSACSTLARRAARAPATRSRVVELGLHHEQQHQELILTDSSTLLGAEPAAARRTATLGRAAAPPRPRRSRWRALRGGRALDRPRRAAASRSTTRGRATACCVQPFALALAAGDERRVPRVHRRRRLRRGPSSWLSDGWAWRAGARAGAAPLYWERDDGALDGAHARRRARAREPDEPVVPRQLLRGRRLRALGGRAAADRGRVGDRARPRSPVDGQLRRARAPAPGAGRRRRAASRSSSATSGSGRAAPTRPTPAIAPAAGALGEYNGKFMCNQLVLRGGSCATPRVAHPRDLPQLLPARRALAVLAACGWPGRFKKGVWHQTLETHPGPEHARRSREFLKFDARPLS